MEQGEVVEQRTHKRVVGAKRLFHDRKRPLVERFGLVIAALSSIEQGEVAQRYADTRVIGCQHFFADGEGALVERLGIGVPSLVQ